MNAYELIGVALAVAAAIATVYRILDNKAKQLHDEIHSLKDKVHKLELQSIAGDELTKKHILNCKNYEPRHNIDK